MSVKEWGGLVPPDYLDQVRFQATVLGLKQVQVVHLKPANWSEGPAMIKSGSVPPERLAVHRVMVGEDERKAIEQGAEGWWMKFVHPFLKSGGSSPWGG